MEKIILECYDDKLLIIRALDSYRNSLEKEMKKTEVLLLIKTLEKEIHFLKRVEKMVK